MICFAVATLYLQIKGNRLSEKVNELTRNGNIIGKELWDECYERQVSRIVRCL